MHRTSWRPATAGWSPGRRRTCTRQGPSSCDRSHNLGAKRTRELRGACEIEARAANVRLVQRDAVEDRIAQVGVVEDRVPEARVRQVGPPEVDALQRRLGEIRLT